MKTDLEFLLEEVKKRYPIGTVYWNLNMIGGRSNQEKTALPLEVTKPIAPYVKNKNYRGSLIIALGNYQGYVYSGGKWAEIVYSPNKIIEIW